MAMSTQPTLQEIVAWAREITSFAVTVGANDERRAELTVFDTHPATLDAEGSTLNVTCALGLAAELQNVLGIPQLEQAALAAAKSAATPTLAETKQIDGNQWVSFRVPLHLDGLTRNELAAAIWGVWKAQELLALQLNGFKELEAISSELESIEAEEEESPPQEAPPPATEPSPAPPPETPASPPEAAPAPAPQPAAVSETPPTPTPAPRFCPSCGKEAKPGQRFCIGCGTSLEAQG
jgi:cell division septation protein DedD